MGREVISMAAPINPQVPALRCAGRLVKVLLWLLRNTPPTTTGTLSLFIGQRMSLQTCGVDQKAVCWHRNHFPDGYDLQLLSPECFGSSKWVIHGYPGCVPALDFGQTSGWEAQMGWTHQEVHAFWHLKICPVEPISRKFSEIEVSRFFLNQGSKPISLHGRIQDLNTAITGS